VPYSIAKRLAQISELKYNPPPMAKLTFLGAAGTVTGSKYLVEANGKKLMVDCGLFQGGSDLKQRNWEPMPEAASVDWLVLTHAHLDHTGWIPRFLKEGFKGPIFSNAPTKELCGILLPDSGYLQEEDARRAQQKGYSSHKPALPLYTEAEAQQCLSRFVENSRTDWFTISPEFSVRQHDAGHILGSASLELAITEGGKKTVVMFSGDIGRYGGPILNSPAQPMPADVLLCETTYGDRDHPLDSPYDEMADVVNRVVKRGGVIVIPAFAVDRTQLIMYVLHRLAMAKRIPVLPVYVDSPMAINVTDFYMKHPEENSKEFNEEISSGDPLAVHTVHMTRTSDESRAINNVKDPCVIISASGMATGGRVLHHLVQRLPDAKNAVLLCGFQAEGTGGRALQDGVKSFHVMGQSVPVLAEIVDMKQFSAHAGQSELLKWISGFAVPPRQTYLVHGEPAAALAFQKLVNARPGWKASVAQYKQTVDL
jgi:metallo-beta-lactamase family protein